MRTTVINLFAGPGAGKSTTAADLFARLKMAGQSAELVTEYAKDLVWEEAPMGNQLRILAEQDRRLQRLQGKVRWVITDSPLLLGLCYLERHSRYDTAGFRNAVRWAFRSYRNVNFLLHRPSSYDPSGRNQGTREEAVAIDRKLKNILEINEVPYKAVEVDSNTGLRLTFELPYHEELHSGTN